ncbi:LytR/AlgR family response regulator transcription factor [Fibrella forsythiae]|uniref:LytTR family transcriptional regulator n=1 Tax=Fibrella forsythiae TaxID=2817061 RepID=A0ABS3JT19_9BACT|nr:LytTR family DNA-binding domain-containing protein [Fibrella forsythiae]MBO0953163.1 LytTR family transcriptional regulator [Fibrella forsythiae]
MVFTLPPASAPRLTPLTWPPLRLYIRESGKQLFPVANLVALQSEGNYSWLCWANGQRMLMPRTLKWYMDQLPPAHFIRFHRNCIVNLHYIQRLENTKAGPLAHLTTGETLGISRRRWRGIRRELQLIRETEPVLTYRW